MNLRNQHERKVAVQGRAGSGRRLGSHGATLHRWRKVGWVHARKLPVPGGHWALWADAAELKRLARLRSHHRARRDQPLPTELTTPKARKTK